MHVQSRSVADRGGLEIDNLCHQYGSMRINVNGEIICRPLAVLSRSVVTNGISVFLWCLNIGVAGSVQQTVFQLICFLMQ